MKLLIFCLNSFLILTSCTDKSISFEDIDLKIEGYKLKKEGSDYRIFQKGSDRVFIRKLAVENPTRYQDRIKSRTETFHSIYKSVSATYPGQITKMIECSEEMDLKPKMTQKNQITMASFDLYATSRYAYGSCNRQISPLNMKYILVYCLQSGVSYEIKFFVPRTDKDSTNKIASFPGKIFCR